MNPVPFAHFAVIVPLAIAAPTAAVPLTVAVDTALLEEDETAEEAVEETADDETDEALLELSVPVAEDELEVTELEDTLEGALLDARLLTLAADETALLEDEDDATDFLLSLSLQLTKNAANKIPASGLR